MGNNKPWEDWFQVNKKSNFIPDAFGVPKNRAEDIQHSLSNAVQTFFSTKKMTDASEMFALALGNADIQTPSEFGLMFFYIGQLHKHLLQEEAEGSKSKNDPRVDALTAVIVEMGKMLINRRSEPKELSELKEMFGEGQVKAIKVPPQKAKAVFSMLEQLEKFATEDDEVDELLKAVSQNTTDKKVN